jgi:ribosomal-protein-alanine N-acetyltransferase
MQGGERSIRRATPADSAALRRLQRALAEPAPALLDAALSGVVGDLFVAVTDAPVGYLLAVEGPPALPDVDADAGLRTLPDDATCHVAELVVAPPNRRDGHASALLATLLSTHPTATVTLTVAAGNDAARSLYEGFGFEVRARLPTLFDGDPGLLLARRPRTE